MSYVDAVQIEDTIHVVERVNGDRVYNTYPADYSFYVDDPMGSYTSMFRTPLRKVSAWNRGTQKKEVNAAIAKGLKVWESDINPVFRCLSQHYLGVEAPSLHVGFFDIEANFETDELAKKRGLSEGRGYAPAEDPFNEITAITVYLAWLDQLITMTIAPDTLSYQAASEIAEEFENTIVFPTETEMLETFLAVIEDVDILSGWNSTAYDIPYTVNRIKRVLGKDSVKRMCLFDQLPKEREYEKYGNINKTYDLIGRVHLDYMELYRKYTYEERHSYSLDAIAEYELGEHKTPYEGSLDQLYRYDFKKFIEYNRQDVALLGRMDKKLDFISLASEIAHDAGVVIPKVMGSVAWIDQSVVNESHRRGMIVPNKPKVSKRHIEDVDDDGKKKAAGAYVAIPDTGIQKFVGAIDLTSLYPSVKRALNMGVETVVGQLRPTYTDAYIAEKMENGCSFPEAWEGMFGSLEYQYVTARDTDKIVTVEWADGTTDVASADTIFSMVFESGMPWIMSANGTIFTVEVEGVTAGLLTRWFYGRKEMQAKKKAASELSTGIEMPADLADAVRRILND